jgi:hypothetical protein
VIALACAANAGSAATVIGNRKISDRQYGGLVSGRFCWFAVSPQRWPSGGLRRDRLTAAASGTSGPGFLCKRPTPGSAEAGTAGQGIGGDGGLVVVFSVAEDRATWALAIAGTLLSAAICD